MIRCHELTKKYRRNEALHGLTLEVPEGSAFALLGPNGAGKSTAIKTVMNILRPTSGRAEVLGVDSRRLGPPELSQIGYVSENQELPEWMTIGAFLAYCKPLYPGWRDEDAAVVAIGLDRFFDIRRHRQAEEAQLARASGTSRSKKTGPACARARWWERISQHGMSSAKAAGSRQGRARQPIAAWSRMTPRPASL